MNERTVSLKHKGRIGQTGIYLGKMFRMFIYQSDWKVIPMAGVITAIVSIVIAKSMNITMEGTVRGGFALSCICIWNGFFNSIQSVCRERAIVKREHRSGMHITSYIAAHMIYQAFLCLLQVGAVIAVLNAMKVTFPQAGVVFGDPRIDMGVTLFFVTFAADMISLFVSCIVHNPTTAMTIVPFLLIFQLIFAGTFFNLPKKISFLKDFTISNYGICALCSQGRFNELKMTTVWKTLEKMEGLEVDPENLKKAIRECINGETSDPEQAKETVKDVAEKIADKAAEAAPVMSDAAIDEITEMAGSKPIKFLLDSIEESNEKDEFQLLCGKQGYNKAYESKPDNVINCWITLILDGLLFAGLSVIALEFIDKDKR